ncbi:MAG: SMC-Scp complex subunit ScpB [Candidatus Micrarchaeota archaeon]|nr:SMC-Scp complex subunit ScpB [Candidatus Micrarchaeota archaeon]
MSDLNNTTRDPKRIIEAVLFMSTEPVSLNKLCELTGISAPGHIKALIVELKHEYEERHSAIGIVEEPANEYIMTVHQEYIDIVKNFAKESNFSKDELRVLAYVSQSKIVLKSDLAKNLGSSIYSAVKSLVEKGFLEARKKGRTSELRLTKKFNDYFKISDLENTTIKK